MYEGFIKDSIRQQEVRDQVKRDFENGKYVGGVIKNGVQIDDDDEYSREWNQLKDKQKQSHNGE